MASRIVFALVVAAAEAFAVGGSVDTTSGIVRGHAAAGTDGVSEYLGIPYGRPPIGDLRFAPPEKVERAASEYDATFNKSCPANAMFGPEGISAFHFINETEFGEQGIQLIDILSNTHFSYDEDCLRLNIWSKSQSGEARKAVMVFIYGGGFNVGSASDPRYSGKHLADTRDVVVVSMHYRLNIFGFPQAPNTRQNLGILDQRMALEWVRDNVEKFGGDPTRITLFGQSAGGMSTDFHALAFTDDPIVAGYIAQSGNALSINPVTKTENDPWYKAAQMAGCGDRATDQATVLACMRSKSMSDILVAISGKPGFSAVVASQQFNPAVDDIVVFADSDERLKRGDFTKRPLLLGDNDNEAGLYKPLLHALIGLPIPQLVADGLNLLISHCKVPVRAKAGVNAGQTVWRYRWYGYFDNTALGLGPDSSTSYHEAELSTIFGTSADIRQPNTPQQDKIQEYMMNAWTAFAKDPAAGLNGLGWPEYKSTDLNMLQLAYQNRTGPNPTNSAVLDKVCNGVDKTLHLPKELGDALRAVLAPQIISSDISLTGALSALARR